MKYEWKITGIKTASKDNIENAVVQVYWKKIGITESGDTGEFSGATPFKIDDVDDKNFVPFSQLTEEQVIEWIKSVVVGDYENHVNSRIQFAIDQKSITQVEDVKMPWVIS